MLDPSRKEATRDYLGRGKGVVTMGEFDELELDMRLFAFKGVGGV
jgi:hypothetical protein